MSEKERNKAGLHKKISSIFSGVLIPQSDSGQKLSGTSAPEDTDYTEPKQPVQELQKPESPKHNQPEQILPEAKPAHTPKFMTAQESRVVPIQETEAEPVQEPKAEPVQESEAKPAHRHQFVTAKKTKVETTRQSKVIPVQRPKADNENIAKKRTAVKIVSNGFWGQITNKLFAPKPGVSTTKQKVMVVMVPVLFIFLLIFVFRGGVFGTSENKAEAGDENNASSVASAGLNAQIDWKIPETYPKTLRDPMRLGPVERAPDQNESGGLVELTVKSILYSEDKSSAVIGNSIVHEGEQIRGVSIIKINRDNVKFEMNGKTWFQEVRR